MTTETGPSGFHLHSCEGMVPTQAEGRTVDGRPFYFRARWGRWTLHLGNAAWPVDIVEWPKGDPAAGWNESIIAMGDDPTDGYVPLEQVVAILTDHFGPCLTLPGTPTHP